jgi:hypothetical protein
LLAQTDIEGTMTETTDKKKRATLDELIAQTESRVAELKARKEALEAKRLTALLKGHRSDDNRRKILIGAMNLTKLDHPERGARARAALARDLDTYLTRPDDRALFAELLAEHHARQVNPAPAAEDQPAAADPAPDPAPDVRQADDVQPPASAEDQPAAADPAPAPVPDSRQEPPADAPAPIKHGFFGRG